MPVFVACSTFGAVNGGIFASSRLFFVAARNGHMPKMMSLINCNTLTPMPCLIVLVNSSYQKDVFQFFKKKICFQGTITLLMLTTDDVFILINYTSFTEALFWGVSVAGLLYLRYKQPERERPIKV